MGLYPHSEGLGEALFSARQSHWFRSHRLLTVLNDIAAKGDPSMAWEVSPLLWGESDAVVSATANCLSALLLKIPVSELPSFDIRLRNRWGYEAHIKTLDRSLLKKIEQAPKKWGAFAVSASHPSGYVRESAIEHLAQEECDVALPFLLLRTTDWVEPVRHKALDAVRKFLDPKYSKQWLKCLPLVYRFQYAKRHQPSDLFSKIEEIVGSQPELQEMTGSPGFIRYLFRIIKKQNPSLLDELIAKATSHPDRSIRQLACDWLSEGEPPSPLLEKYTPQLLADSSSVVRHRAIWKIASAQPEKYKADLKKALLDTNAATQEQTRFTWNQAFQSEPLLPYYKAQIASAASWQQVVAALRGLRAEGKANEQEIVRPYLLHKSRHVRKEALRTLVSWNVEDAQALLREALLSSSATCSRLAARLLSRHPAWIEVSALHSLLKNSESNYSGLVAVGLIPFLNKWKGLPLLLDACSNSEEAISRTALRGLTNWCANYNKSGIAPSSSEIVECIQAYEKNKSIPQIATAGWLKSIITELQHQSNFKN